MLSLRLTAAIFSLITTALFASQGIGRLLPVGQIIPIVHYNSSIITLVDINRQLAASRRAASQNITDAAISPDQQRIAFSMSDGKNVHVYGAFLYERDYHQLTPETLYGDSVTWSPDSQHIAFVGLEQGNKRGIYIIAADGTSPPETIMKAGTYAGPTWSGNGQQLAFAITQFRDLPDIYIVDSDCRLRCDRQLVQITNTLVADTQPVWSPDGKHLAFLSNRSGHYEIYALDMTCLQPTHRRCTLQTPRHLWLKPDIQPTLMLWATDSPELIFRGRDMKRNEPGLYAADMSCFDGQQACIPRLIYNLTSVSR